MKGNLQDFGRLFSVWMHCIDYIKQHESSSARHDVDEANELDELS